MLRVPVRRLSLALGSLIAVSLVLATSSSAAGPAPAKGGGGFLPAGNYNFTTQRASFNLFGPDPSQPQIGLFVSGGPSASRPLGGPATTTNTVTMFFIGAIPDGTRSYQGSVA